ncbi:hypothetical protein Y032_0030g2156 [Ancylostoma ceylanicum]|uniref:Uncharacterized protein n=1 Tax=Ancylostoma ceylanicum TaxID=53326 RepID=A0A016USY9_9BILA|nr:hypothetical protein Y032_0030g2156 [Ancylostoma ceylanicum]
MQLLKRRAWKWKQSRVVLADCEKPKKFPEEKSKSFVKKINDRRRLMVQGKQKNGRLPSFLPLGENVVEMVSIHVGAQDVGSDEDRYVSFVIRRDRTRCTIITAKEWESVNSDVIRVRRRPKCGDASRRIPRCDKGVNAFRGVESPGKMKKCTEMGPVLLDRYACTQCDFLSSMLSVLSYAYFLIIPFPTLCPFHSCLNEPLTSFCSLTVNPRRRGRHSGRRRVCC